MHRSLVYLCLLSLISIIPGRSDAARVGIRSFGAAAQTTTFDGLGFPVFGNPGPLVVDDHRITTDNGIFRYTAAFAGCFANECVGTDDDLGFFDIALRTPHEQAGVWVSSNSGGSRVQAAFFDVSNVLLGSFDILTPIGSAPGFAGWRDASAGGRNRAVSCGKVHSAR